MPLVSDLPPEILDSIIDELQDDKGSLLQASLACRALYPRTRVYLFYFASLSLSSQCDRLRALITLSPNLARHFKYLRISLFCRPRVPPPHPVYRALTVIESLVNVTHLSLELGDWRYMPDSLVSSLQSHSYRSLEIGHLFCFRSIGEICSLLKNSPELQLVDISCRTITQKCNMDHSLHCKPAPVVVRIDDTKDDSTSAGTFLKSVLSFGSCPFSSSSIHTLDIESKANLPQCLTQYLSSRGPLKHLYVDHTYSGIQSGNLHVSGIQQISVTLVFPEIFNRAPASQIFEWWISNLSAVDENCTIRLIDFKIIVETRRRRAEEHPALDWEDLWTRLDECLTSSRMASLERVAITFDPEPAYWNILKAEMGVSFLGLKKLGREVILDAVARRRS
ncbi:hypothetical protein IW262DRAFT_138111 [Armillaria fumosa]|nr:hypothetical protein IW262DRAFT_138111 [Armillaria fumosa]